MINNPSLQSAILSLRKLDKIYPGDIHAVNRLDYEIERGSLCALLGPNGAGKSTLIGMICGLCIPSSGEIFFNGNMVTTLPSDYRKTIGVVSQHINLEPDLTVYQNLKIHSLLYNLERKETNKRIASLLELAKLTEKRNSIVRSLSGGMKRRLQIIRALLHEPEFIILDEPTIGLDPSGREAIWDMIIGLNMSGKTILFSTHYMEEAQKYAKRVSIINQGRIISDGSPEDLINTLGQWCRAVYSDTGKKTDFFSSREEASVPDNENQSQFIIRRTSLEDVFVSLTGRVFKGDSEE